MTEAWISRSLFVAWAMGMRLGRLQYDYGFKCAKGLWPFVQYVQHVKISQYKFQSANFTVQFHSSNFTVCSVQFKNGASMYKFHNVFSTVQEQCKHVQISQCIQHKFPSVFSTVQEENVQISQCVQHSSRTVQIVQCIRQSARRVQACANFTM